MMKKYICAIATFITLFTGLTASAFENVETLVHVESLYNEIFVYKQNDIVLLTFHKGDQKFIESAHDTTNPLIVPLRYLQVMSVGCLYAGSFDHAYFIGLGGGKLPSYLHHYMPDMKIQIAEIDNKVFDLAQQYFGYQEDENLKTIIGDGRKVLAKSDRKYDLFMLDAHHAPLMPFHMLTQEFYQLVEDRLSDNGVVVQNLEPTSVLFDSVVMTMKSVFDHVDYYAAHANVIVVAYNGPPKTIAGLKRTAHQMQNEYSFLYDPGSLLGFSKDVNVDPDAQILTDDFAPVEYLSRIKAQNRHLFDPSDPDQIQ